MCELADRFRLSNAALVGIVSKVLQSGGGDLDDFDLSVSTARRERLKTRKEEYERFYTEFKAPKHSIVGWDGKIVKACNILGSDKNIEYLAVVLFGEPDLVEGKVVEVEEIDSSSGAAQAHAVYNVLEACGSLDNIRGNLKSLHELFY